MASFVVDRCRHYSLRPSGLVSLEVLNCSRQLTKLARASMSLWRDLEACGIATALSPGADGQGELQEACRYLEKHGFATSRDMVGLEVTDLDKSQMKQEVRDCVCE